MSTHGSFGYRQSEREPEVLDIDTAPCSYLWAFLKKTEYVKWVFMFLAVLGLRGKAWSRSKAQSKDSSICNTKSDRDVDNHTAAAEPQKQF
jgi:hypothetical protein